MDHKCPTCGAAYKVENGRAMDIFFFAFFSTLSALLVAAFVPDNYPAIGVAWMFGLLIGSALSIKLEKMNARSIRRIACKEQE